MDTLRETARAATSRPVQRAVVNTVLLIASAATLFCLAAVASALFFQNYVPDQVTTTPVHLQYGFGANPYGLIPLKRSTMKTQQDYDVSVTLSMPRSKANTDLGNFMVDLWLIDGDAGDFSVDHGASVTKNEIELGTDKVVFRSRRPTLVPYVDPIVSVAHRVLFLFYHLLVSSSQTIAMTIPLAERVSFNRAADVPAAAYVEVEAGQGIQIYSAQLIVTAQLRGLRWLMFHYRLPTYLAFTFMFWLCELLFMVVAWMVWSSVSQVEGDPDGKPHRLEGSQRPALEGRDGGGGDDDDDDESDHSQGFHSYGRQSSVKGEPGVKSEAEHEQSLSEVPMAGADADDEDEDDEDEASDGLQREFGVATSYSEEGRETVRKRRPSH